MTRFRSTFTANARSVFVPNANARSSVSSINVLTGFHPDVRWLAAKAASERELHVIAINPPR
jgi:hypothetical protein